MLVKVDSIHSRVAIVKSIVYVSISSFKCNHPAKNQKNLTTLSDSEHKQL